jgi:hypothetical protein
MFCVKFLKYNTIIKVKKVITGSGRIMRKKIIALITSLTLVIGIVSAVFVSRSLVKATSLTAADQLYINAYDATTNSINKKTQKSINDARAAIIQLQGTGAQWAIGEFSRQVDQIQHPILVKIVEAIKLAEINPIQANVNSAKASIDGELPQIWRNSYSSAVDVIQQGTIKKAVEAYNKAIKTQDQIDIDMAFEKINELITAKDNTVTEWASIIKRQLEESISFTIISIT